MSLLHNTTRSPWIEDRNYRAHIILNEDPYKSMTEEDLTYYNNILQLIQFRNPTPQTSNIKEESQSEKAYSFFCRRRIKQAEKKAPTWKEPLPLSPNFEREYSVKLYKKALEEGDNHCFPPDSACRLGLLITHFELQDKPDITTYKTFDHLISEKSIDINRGKELMEHYQRMTQEGLFPEKDRDSFLSYILLHSTLSEEEKLDLSIEYQYEQINAPPIDSWNGLFWKKLGFRSPNESLK